ncbi:hypothetical protein Tco_0280649 [Tanacetum coccineum]
MNLKLKLTLSNYSHLQLHIQEKERLKHVGKPQRDTKLPQTSVSKDLGANGVVHKEWVTVWKGLSLLWQYQAPRHHGGTPAQTRSERVLEKPNEPPLSEGHTFGSKKGGMEHQFELTTNKPIIPYDSPLPEGYTPGSGEELLEKMLNLQLEAEEESTMAFVHIKFIKSMLEE